MSNSPTFYSEFYRHLIRDLNERKSLFEKRLLRHYSNHVDMFLTPDAWKITRYLSFDDEYIIEENIASIFDIENATFGEFDRMVEDEI